MYRTTVVATLRPQNVHTWPDSGYLLILSSNKYIVGMGCIYINICMRSPCDVFLFNLIIAMHAQHIQNNICGHIGASKCIYMGQILDIYLWCPAAVCRYLPLSAAVCHCLLLSAAICCYLLLYAAICCYLPLSAAICLVLNMFRTCSPLWHWDICCTNVCIYKYMHALHMWCVFVQFDSHNAWKTYIEQQLWPHWYPKMYIHAQILDIYWFCPPMHCGYLLHKRVHI